MRTRSATRHQLGEDAVGDIQVNERHLHPKETGPWLGVDQLGALVPQPGELTRKILDLVGDVVHPRPALRKEAADRGVGPERTHQLDVPVADVKGDRLDALWLARLTTAH